MLDSVCMPNLTAVIRFEPNGIELLVDRRKLIAVRGGIQLSEVLIQEGMLTKSQVQDAQRIAPSFLEALPLLGLEQSKILEVLRTQIISTLMSLSGNQPIRFSVYSVQISSSMMSADFSVSDALFQILLAQEAELEAGLNSNRNKPSAVQSVLQLV